MAALVAIVVCVFGQSAADRQNDDDKMVMPSTTVSSATVKEEDCRRQ
jgi:hypothetical protein